MGSAGLESRCQQAMLPLEVLEGSVALPFSLREASCSPCFLASSCVAPSGLRL